jgi:hypothetical protein
MGELIFHPLFSNYFSCIKQLIVWSSNWMFLFVWLVFTLTNPLSLQRRLGFTFRRKQVLVKFSCPHSLQISSSMYSDEVDLVVTFILTHMIAKGKEHIEFLVHSCCSKHIRFLIHLIMCLTHYVMFNFSERSSSTGAWLYSGWTLCADIIFCKLCCYFYRSQSWNCHNYHTDS